MDGYVVAVAILLFFFIHLWRQNRNNPLPNWPIIGMSVGFFCNLSNIYDFLTKVLKYHGGTFMIQGPWFTNIKFVITSDPTNVQHITGKNFSNYGKEDILHSLFKNNTFESFHHQIIQKKLETSLIPFLSHASKEGTQVELQDIFQRFTFDNICSMVLGFDPNCLPNNFNELSETHYSKILCKLQKWFRIGHEKDLSESQVIVDQLLHECIASRCENQSKYNSNQADESNFDVLKALMGETGNEQIDHKFLRDTALNLLFAGRDTISASLSWFFWLVSTHPLVEAKILEQIRDTFVTKQESWVNIGVDELKKLVYLHGAICETLRLFPPVPMEHKCAIKSDILPSGYIIYPNTMVLYSLYAMGRNEETWGKDCLEFKPERWISEKGAIYTYHLTSS
ncbi:putative alkane 1-monooxygenase [Lupinus albus]|uniref:Putative alkane 1-monooxygenase n=1 Tax=Lupinus albus TaxID=3870 RepID=A0A6A4QNZ6_LUPAL|nr:putative alkane 1-monooxygenase [Lupinus albus]